MNTHYIMEDNREAERLSQKVEPEQWVARYFSPYLTTAREVLEVGCGPGALVSEIARQYSDVQVKGVDVSEQRLTYARKTHSSHNLNFHCANANALPFADHQFDLVYSRLMLEYLNDPLAAVNEMKRVCAPGGRVVLQDLDGQLIWHFPEPDFQDDLNAVLKALSTTGHDVLVGRKLYSFAVNAGLKNIQVTLDPYHLYAGAIGAKEREEWDLKLEIALPQIAKVHGQAKAVELKRQFMEYLDDDSTLTYSVLFTVVGEVAA
jgi:ubiquinone/menaquinone biosynthesis C-methylase UbiE